MTDSPDTSSAPSGGSGALIKDGTTATFVDDVISASKEVPVIVDLWATWCAPCRTLSPIIEKVVNAANGAVKLVKIDVDQNPELMQQLRVKSIPSVYAFKNGQPVDGFIGAMPESQVRDFVTALSGGEGPAPPARSVGRGQ